MITSFPFIFCDISVRVLEKMADVKVITSTENFVL
jgi:hypothetical protein